MYKHLPITFIIIHVATQRHFNKHCVHRFLNNFVQDMFNTYFGLLFSVDEWICLSLDSLGVAVSALRCISSLPTWPITQAD